ncbi:MAG: SPOR domain-containing protein [Pseudomonadota bacterium]
MTVSTWLGAAVALVVLLILGTWFYQLGVRDARSVPVIRASTEPVKTRPVDVGGEVTPHQDIASYDAGSPEPRPEPRPQLADPAPEPAEEDVALAELQPSQPEPVTREELTPPIAPEPEEEPSVRASVITSDPPPAAPAERSEQTEPEEEVAAAPAPAPGSEIETPLPPAGEGSRLAPAFSPTVQTRPADLRVRMQRALENAESAQDRLAERAQTSRVKIQLRASPSRDEVVRAWRRLQAANRDILGQKALALQTTSSGGTTFYRLRVGPFRDRAEANAVCQALRARGQDCIVTTSG